MLCKASAVCQTLESGDAVMTSGWSLPSESLGSGGILDKFEMMGQHGGARTEVLQHTEEHGRDVVARREIRRDVWSRCPLG